MPQVTGSNIITSTQQIGDQVIATADIADLAVTEGKLANNAVVDGKIGAHVTTKITTPLALLANAGGAAGDVAYWNGANWIKLPIGAGGALLGANAAANAPAFLAAVGAAGQVLKSAGAGAVPAFGDLVLVPNWVDIETLSWAASDVDQTSAAFAVYDLIMVVLSFTKFKKLQLRLNGSAGAGYHDNTIAANAVVETAAQTSMVISDAGAGDNATLIGTLLISGKAGIAGNTLKTVAGQLCGANGNGGIKTLIKGGTTAEAANLTNLTILVNANAATGKAHIYGLNL